jgi:haloacid dehalogenase-like hydrolase
MSSDDLPGWRETPAKRTILEFVGAVTDPDSRDFVPERDRIAVFDNDGTLWTEQPAYAQLVFALHGAAELGHPSSLDELRAGGMPALMELVALTHAGITTEEFDAACQSWLASARHPRFGRLYPQMVYQPMLELLTLLGRRGFSCWIFSGGGTDFMRTWAADVYGLPPHRVIGSVGETEFRVGDDGPELIKTAKVQFVDGGPLKPSSIHQHVGQRPIMAAGNTDGDLVMLQWTAGSPHRSLELVIRHIDADREYAYARDPILGSGTDEILAAGTDRQWTVIDMAADWAVMRAPAR